MNDSQISPSDASILGNNNFYKRFKPSKEIEQALNVREGQNRAK
jgi:hypothetical protein